MAKARKGEESTGEGAGEVSLRWSKRRLLPSGTKFRPSLAVSRPHPSRVRWPSYVQVSILLLGPTSPDDTKHAQMQRPGWGVTKTPTREKATQEKAVMDLTTDGMAERLGARATCLCGNTHTSRSSIPRKS
ncbi:hypothetical protein CMUS01_10259 [Colletotrichum musicola]|uniref:Uncharacterized protein n=1 Tax=Colletotrichum musicola TaxID=2175873 RepID=A0A8H6K471_9PEZI|nr:hypothetical protein CMUS01_10259 [Colletotrichum musicola]